LQQFKIFDLNLNGYLILVLVSLAYVLSINLSVTASVFWDYPVWIKKLPSSYWFLVWSQLISTSVQLVGAALSAWIFLTYVPNARRHWLWFPAVLAALPMMWFAITVQREASTDMVAGIWLDALKALWLLPLFGTIKAWRGGKPTPPEE